MDGHPFPVQHARFAATAKALPGLLLAVLCVATVWSAEETACRTPPWLAQPVATHSTASSSPGKAFAVAANRARGAGNG